MPFVIRLWRLGGSPLGPKENKAQKVADAAVKLAQGRADEMVGEYLQSFDVEAFDGRGDATFTTDIAKAMQFADHAAAFAAWTKQSVTRPLRPDGKPNKPLTTFNVTFEKVPQ